jgi:hypothetical protein
LGLLAGLVLVRTFLSWTLVLEIDGRWPWGRKLACNRSGSGRQRALISGPRGEMPMNWNQLYGLKNYLKSSLWLVPFIAIPLALVLTGLLVLVRTVMLSQIVHHRCSAHE